MAAQDPRRLVLPRPGRRHLLGHRAGKELELGRRQHQGRPCPAASPFPTPPAADRTAPPPGSTFRLPLAPVSRTTSPSRSSRSTPVSSCLRPRSTAEPARRKQFLVAGRSGWLEVWLLRRSARTERPSASSVQRSMASCQAPPRLFVDDERPAQLPTIRQYRCESCLTPSASRCAVGSSRSTGRGQPASAAARATRCRLTRRRAR